MTTLLLIAAAWLILGTALAFLIGAMIAFGQRDERGHE